MQPSQNLKKLLIALVRMYSNQLRNYDFIEIIFLLNNQTFFFFSQAYIVANLIFEMKKVFIKTHGCQMNEYDSAKMLDLLKGEEDYELAESEQQADLLILNTCSIREKAQEKVFHQIGRWKKIKDSNPDLKIAIGGCVASQEGEKIIKRAPSVDIAVSYTHLTLPTK